MLDSLFQLLLSASVSVESSFDENLRAVLPHHFRFFHNLSRSGLFSKLLTDLFFRTFELFVKTKIQPFRLGYFRLYAFKCLFMT